MPDQDALYPIREISRLTGVTPITLRAWERRYDLIEPVRTDSGHRLYTQDHVDFINQAVELTKQGIPISKVKAVLLERQSAQKVRPADVDIDYAKEIKVTCEQLDFANTQQLVEQLFVDLLESQVKEVLVQVDIELSKDSAVQILWQSVVIPLLAARIRQGRRLLDRIGRKNIYVGCLSDDQLVLQRILSNTALESGFNPLLSTSTERTSLIEDVKKLHCEAVLLIGSRSDESEMSEWLEWSRNHKSIEVFFATLNQPIKHNSLNFKVISMFDTTLNGRRSDLN